MNGTKIFAALYGVMTHLIFLFAVILMFFSLLNGLGGSTGYFSWQRSLWDLGLLIQFPLIHSLLLTQKGRSILSLRNRSKLARHLVTTTFALIASLQLIVVFEFWRSTGVVIWEPPRTIQRLLACGFIFSWILLAKSMWDSDITLQTGIKGWFSVIRNRKPEYRSFPDGGVYRFCRQPIYLSYILILVSSPHWTLDRMMIALIWGSYCILGAIAKERRFLQFFGEEFQKYRERVPFMLPINPAFGMLRSRFSTPD